MISPVILISTAGIALAQKPQQAEALEVTILSSNLANGATIGEWGFSALIQVDDKCILFDAGRYPDTVLRNAKVLNVDLSCVTDVVLSHFHFDHTTGLLPLFNKIRAENPNAFQRIHVAKGFFLSRQTPRMAGDDEWNGMIAARKELEAQGVEFRIYSEPTEIMPSIWVTGPVVRTHKENTYNKSLRMRVDNEWVEDFVPDSQGLTIVTVEGPIVLLGCGHSGSVNLLEQVQRSIQSHPILALMGGMHLFAASEVELDWTAKKLNDIGIQHLMAGHCNGHRAPDAATGKAEPGSKDSRSWCCWLAVRARRGHLSDQDRPVKGWKPPDNRMKQDGEVFEADPLRRRLPHGEEI